VLHGRRCPGRHDEQHLRRRGQGLLRGPLQLIRYAGPQEKTAAGSAVLGGIVFWPSFSPPASATVSACELSGEGDLGRSWQADAITGLPDQSDGSRLTDEEGPLLGFVPAKTRDAWERRTGHLLAGGTSQPPCVPPRERPGL
jgi:hypothetical protein